MTTELIMREDMVGAFFNAGAFTKAGLSLNATNQMPNPASRLATMQVLAGKKRRMNMKQGLSFVRSRKGRPISRSSRGVPGAVPGGVTPVDGSQVTTNELRKRRKLAKAAKATMRKTKGTPEVRVRKTIIGLLWLFTGKGARKLNAEGKKVAKSIMMVATSRAKQNQFPALTMAEIEGLFKIATS